MSVKRKKENINIADQKTERGFKLVCEKLSKLDNYLIGVMPFKLLKIISKGEEVFIFQNFTLCYATSKTFSIEQHILSVIKSWPLGIDMELQEVDEENHILQIWKIKKARMNSIEFGMNDFTSTNNKKIFVEFSAKDIELNTLEDNDNTTIIL